MSTIDESAKANTKKSIAGIRELPSFEEFVATTLTPQKEDPNNPQTLALTHFVDKLAIVTEQLRHNSEVLDAFSANQAETNKILSDNILEIAATLKTIQKADPNSELRRQVLLQLKTELDKMAKT